MARRGKKKCVPSKGAEFFKVFLPHKSHHRIMIPPDFVKDFKRTICEKVILKDVYGKEWHVYVKETLDGFFLESGWESYIDYHSLKFGEFLVFRYVGSYTFMVKIFGTNGCKKKIASENACVKIEDKSEDEMEEKPTSHKRPREDHLLIDYNNEHSERFEEVKESEEQNVDSECPSFISLAIQSSSRKLRIPDELINKHNLKFEPEMILRNENGKGWPVKTFETKHAKLIGKGWHAFQIDNNMRSNDRCKLTFDNKRPICRTANVQILRSGPDSSLKYKLKHGRGRPKKNDNFWVQVTANSSCEKVPYSEKENPPNEKVPYSDDLPEFFKVYVSDMSSEMSIPPAFIEEFGENIPTICTLEKNPSGLSWKVDMNRVDDDWFFQNGWPEFVHENSIQDRDFLTFAYARNSTFYVKVYSRNCCLKMPEKIVYETTEILLEDEASQQVHAENPNNRRSTRIESPMERTSLNTNPSFKLQITKSYVTNSFLTVPMPFWRLHMGKMSGMVTLWIKNEIWNMTLKNTGDRINLVDDVPKFVRMNSLKIGTVCTFELIDSNKLAFNVTVDG